MANLAFWLVLAVTSKLPFLPVKVKDLVLAAYLVLIELIIVFLAA